MPQVMFSCRSTSKSSRTHFQIAAPGRPDPTSWIDSWNMGPPSARRKRANGGQMRPAAGTDSGLGDPPRLINLGGFDKAKPPAGQPSAAGIPFGRRFVIFTGRLTGLLKEKLSPFQPLPPQ